MNYILNELSLNAQFKSTSEFIESSLTSYIEIFKLCSEFNIPLLKKYDFYNSKITQDLSFNNILLDPYISRTTDEIKRLKILIDKLIGEPYWELDSKIDGTKIYLYLNQNVSNTGLAEAYERNSCLISFVPSNFLNDNLCITKVEVQKNIDNFYSKAKFLNHLYNCNQIIFYNYCLKYFQNTKLDFSKSNFKESFEKISTKTDESIFLSSFKMFIEMTWENIIAQGGKGKNKAGLAYILFHDQNLFSQYNLDKSIYKFRVNDKFRVFGYRVKDVFHVLEFDLTHKYSD